jgi:rare lipoprotein A
MFVQEILNRSATVRGIVLTALCGAFLTLTLSGCGGGTSSKSGKYYADDGPPADFQKNHIKPDAVPKVEPRSKGGNPDSYVVFGKRYHVLKSGKGYVERGIASWYGKMFHGRRTSNGEVYDMYGMTAAHKTLPIPSYAEVKNIRTGKKIIVRVNDRGPFHDGRIIDLSYAAAQKLGVASTGTGLVEVRAIDPLTWQQDKQTRQIAQIEIPSEKADRKSRIYIQLGAFSQKGNASALFALAKRNSLYKPFIANGKDQYGNEVYRVRIGPFNGVDHVDSMIARLLEVDLDEFHVVIE